MDSVAVKTAIDTDGRALRTLAAVRELDPKIRASANEIEEGRRLPLHIVREMQRAGVFRMSMPRAWGGSELDLPSQLEVIETLSIANGSVGWCAMIGTDGGYTTAFIDQTVAREMYTDVDVGTAITFAPPGKA
jgi:alkylation response protein AidB-like acyl-CoA dehydrogenase